MYGYNSLHPFPHHQCSSYNSEQTNMEYTTHNNTTQEQGRQVICPYCGSHNTELFSLFGQQLLTVQYYCNECHTPFEHVKDDDVLSDYQRKDA